MHIFYLPNIESGEVILNEEESKHCAKVLRLNRGETIHLADGKGKHYRAMIVDAHPKKTLLEIIDSEMHLRLFTYSLHIAITPTKNTERIEWFIEKSVECGINAISFIETKHSERIKVNMERCQKIAVSAMKQSQQWHLPTINPIRPFSEFVKQHMATKKLIAWCNASSNEGLAKHLSQTDSTILIGPEGDFTSEEITLAEQYGYTPLSLGKSILRTETAALFCCMSMKTIFG
jgi:16S rRNA (uracil1498-N3)-methyltransferase